MKISDSDKNQNNFMSIYCHNFRQIFSFWNILNNLKEN